MFHSIAEAVAHLAPGSTVPPSDKRIYSALHRLAGPKATQKLLLAAGANGVRRMPARELAAVAEVPLRVAERVVAARELGEAFATAPERGLRAASDVVRHLPLGFAELEVEVMLAFALSSQFGILATVVLGKGGASELCLTAREVLVPLLRQGAVAFVLIHNHPGGGVARPSEQDVLFTNAIASAARVVGLHFVDHVIVARSGSFSFQDSDLMPTDSELAGT